MRKFKNGPISKSYQSCSFSEKYKWRKIDEKTKKMEGGYASDFGFNFDLLPLLSFDKLHPAPLVVPPLLVISEKLPSVVDFRKEFKNSYDKLSRSTKTKKKNTRSFSTSFSEWKKENINVDNFKGFSAFRKKISILKFLGKRNKRIQNKSLVVKKSKFPGKSKAASKRKRNHGKFAQEKT
jgi:hypothetical protein